MILDPSSILYSDELNQHQLYSPDSGEVIDWNRLRLYTIMDLLNSPIRSMMLNNMRGQNY